MNKNIISVSPILRATTVTTYKNRHMTSGHIVKTSDNIGHQCNTLKRQTQYSEKMPNPTIRTYDLEIPFGELARQIKTYLSALAE